MRNVLIIFLVVWSSSSILARLSGGRVRDTFGTTIGYVEDGVVRNRSYSTIGYYTKEGRIQDRYHTTIYKVRKDGSVLDRGGRKIGQVKGDRLEGVGKIEGGSQVEKVAIFFLLL